MLLSIKITKMSTNHAEYFHFKMMSYVNVLVLLLVACFSRNALADSNEEFESTDSVHYPKSAALEEVFWDLMEEINQTEPGQLLIRDVRNTIGNLMKSPAYWNACSRSAELVGNLTNDPETANKIVTAVNKLADILENQQIVEKVMEIIAFLINQISALDSPDIVVGSLKMLSDNIENGNADVMVQKLSEIADQTNLNPQSVVQGFNKLKSTMSKSANKRMTDREADSILRMSNFLNRSNLRQNSITY